MDIKNIHGLDQAMEDLRRQFIPGVFSFYTGCLEAGFDKDQAFALARDFMNSTMSKPPKQD